MIRHRYIILILVILVTVIILKLPPRTATQFKLAISTLFLPLFGLSTSTQHAAEKAGNVVMPKKVLLKQNEDLRRENAELQLRLQRLSTFETENEQLRAMLSFQRSSPWKLRAAHVIARDPANWWRNVRIDLGRRDGIVPDLPVLTSEGLIGRVSDVSENFARVVLIGDSDCRVPAAVIDYQQGPRGRSEPRVVDNGVINSGSSVLNENVVELGFFANASAVKPGLRVETSELSAIFPKGILIGQIIDTRPVDFGLHSVARVKLAVNLNLLDEVWVKMP